MLRSILTTITATAWCVLSAQTYIAMPVSQNPPFGVSANEVYVEFVPPTMTIGGDLVVTGGSGSYTYLWKHGSTEIGREASIEISEAGVYELNISDACDCLQRVVFTVNPASVEGVGTSEVSVYPNPASDRLTVSGMSLVQVSIVSMSGKLVAVHSGFGRDARADIDVSGLPAGEYIVNLVGENHKVVTRKIVKQ